MQTGLLTDFILTIIAFLSRRLLFDVELFTLNTRMQIIPLHKV